MFSIDWTDWGKRSLAIAAGLFVRQQPAYREFRSKIAPDADGPGLDDGADAFFLSLVVELVQYGKNVDFTRVAKRAALLFGGLLASQQDFYKGLKARVVAEDPSSFGLDDGFDAGAYSLVVELGQGLF